MPSVICVSVTPGPDCGVVLAGVEVGMAVTV